MKWGLDRLSRPCFVQYNIDIEYFSGDISDSAAAKRVEILRWSVYRCTSLYKHRKRCKKRLDFTPFRSNDVTPKDRPVFTRNLAARWNPVVGHASWLHR